MIPVPGVGWADVRQVALEVKALLEEMGLRGWPKTSGSRGMHVNVRIEPRWTFTEVRRAALALSRAVERRVPALARSKWWKEERHGVFLDYNQNAKDRTTCSAYSVRPLPDARVSTPLSWDEVPDCDPADFTVFTVPQRFAKIGDPHADMDAVPGSLEKLLELAARDEAAGLGDAPWPPHFRKMEGEAPRVAPSRAKSAAAKAGTKPQDEDAADRGRELSQTRGRAGRLERWKASTARPPSLLAVDDVLVDSMRGRSSTWTRIRVNLRHVPEEQRPPQETPDPDDDPTREWRASAHRRRRRVASGSAPCEDFHQLLRRNHFELAIGAIARLLVGAPSPKMRHVAEAVSLHVLVRDLDHKLGPQRLPRQILALTPAALPARHALACAVRILLRPCSPRMILQRILSVRREKSASSCRFASVKLAQTPTCCSAPASSKRPSSSEPIAVPSPFLCQRKPATTQSQSRSCLTLNITRLFGS